MASMLNSRRTIILISISLVAVMGFSLAIHHVAAYINEYGSGGTMKPGTQWYEALDYYESTSQPVTSQRFFIQSNASVDLYLLNATQFSTFSANKTLPATPSWAGINGIITEDWNVTYLHAHYGLPVINETAQKSRHVWMMVLLDNKASANGSVLINVRLGYTPLKITIDDLNVFATWLDISVFGVVSFKLLWASTRLKKIEAARKRSETVRGMGLGYMCVFGAFFLGEFRVYWNNELGGFMPTLFKITYNLTNVPINYFDLFICSLCMLVSLTFLSLTYTVEKKVKDFRYPIISYIQLVATCLFPLVFAIPAMFLFALIFLVGAIGLACALLITVYVNIAIKSTGLPRKRAIFTLLGLAIPLTCFVIREFASNTIGAWFTISLDFATIFGLLSFWYGNMKYFEKTPVVTNPDA